MRTGSTGRVVVEMRARVQLARHALAEALREELLRGGLQLADRVQREDAEALRGLRADALEQAHRVAGEVLDGLLAAHRDERRRLERRARGLGDQPRGPDPDRQRHPGALEDRGDQRAQQRDRQRLLREVEVGLVDSGLLDRRDALADDRPDLRAGRAVGLEVGRDHDRRRAQRPRPRGRHRRVDAVAARLVARGGHDRARPGARDDHRHAAQLRAPPKLDRRVERIDVHVRDDPPRGHATHSAPRRRRVAAGVSRALRPGAGASRARAGRPVRAGRARRRSAAARRRREGRRAAARTRARSRPRRAPRARRRACPAG